MNGPQPVDVDAPDSLAARALGSDAPHADTKSADPERDGRTARSTKTRDAIADALLDLLADGQLRPTAREIAGRANVSLRSVYVHFDDLDDLFCVAARRHYRRIAPMLAATPETGSVTDRARALVVQRVRLYAEGGAVGRATRLNAAFSPTLARLLREAHAFSRADLERVFASELRGVGDAQRLNIIAVLDVLTGSDAWETLLDRHDLTAEAAMQCVVDAIIVHLGTVSV